MVLNTLNQSRSYNTTFVVLSQTHPLGSLELCKNPFLDLMGEIVLNPYNFNYEDKRTSASWVDGTNFSSINTNTTLNFTCNLDKE